ncbi:MAG: hypothetical protein JSW12_22425 [Deltaproteobacteria bacterium]|nr:MAG: hypothetical protein JSW12_22425 [Deltaproteobacteria bacterium]
MITFIGVVVTVFIIAIILILTGGGTAVKVPYVYRTATMEPRQVEGMWVLTHLFTDLEKQLTYSKGGCLRIGFEELAMLEQECS